MPSLFSSRKVRYAVVAGGEISQKAFMPGVAQTSNSEMVALVTGDPVKASELAGQYGLESYSYEQYDALLASGTIDAVYVATPNFLHRQYAEPALRAGIHVLLEKPMATSVEDCEAIRLAAKAGNAKLMIAYRLHCEPGTVEMIERARSGELGDLRTFTAAFSQMLNPENHRAQHGYWEGPVADMGTYPLNAVRNLFGLEPLEVSAVGVKTPGIGYNFHDTVAVTLKFEGERIAQFTTSYTTNAAEHFTLVGTKGTFQAEPCFGYGPGVAITYKSMIDGREKEHAAHVVDQFAGETEYFSDCILDNRDPEPCGEEGMLDVRVLAAIERALETGTVQKLEPCKRVKFVTKDQVRTLKMKKPPTDMVDVVPVQGVGGGNRSAGRFVGES